MPDESPLKPRQFRGRIEITLSKPLSLEMWDAFLLARASLFMTTSPRHPFNRDVEIGVTQRLAIDIESRLVNQEDTSLEIADRFKEAHKSVSSVLVVPLDTVCGSYNFHRANNSVDSEVLEMAKSFANEMKSNIDRSVRYLEMELNEF